MQFAAHHLSRRAFVRSGLATAGAFIALPALARAVEREEWVVLGETLVNHKAEKDTIDLGPRAGPFRAIKLVVRDADLRIFRVRIQFREGEDQTIDFKDEIPRDHATPVIDLPGRRRIIERIVFAYKTPGDEAHRARVIVYGIR